MKKIFLFIGLSFLTSCVSLVPQSIKNEFTYCYDGKNTGIDNLINTNGYFIISWAEESKHPVGYYKSTSVMDTFYLSFIFFNDGAFFSDAFSSNHSDNEYFKQINQHSKKRRNYFFEGLSYGGYIITGDTIKAQCLHKPYSLNDTWLAVERWYKVIDKDKIIEIAYRKLDYDRLNETRSAMDLVIIKEEERRIAKFIPLDTIPNSDSWLKKKKWFWKEEKQYKEWKSANKQKL